MDSPLAILVLESPLWCLGQDTNCLVCVRTSASFLPPWLPLQAPVTLWVKFLCFPLHLQAHCSCILSHSLIQQTLAENQKYCARPGARCLGYRNEQNTAHTFGVHRRGGRKYIISQFQICITWGCLGSEGELPNPV